MHRAQTSTNATKLPNTSEGEEGTTPMALSDATKTWFSRHKLEGFLQIAEAPHYEEPEKVGLQVNLEEIKENMVQAKGLYSIENPATETLTKYFGENSLASKAYQTQGGEDAMFREAAVFSSNTVSCTPALRLCPKTKPVSSLRCTRVSRLIGR